MANPITVGDALRANLDAANHAVESYLESVIDADTYHALHDSSVAAKAALDGYHRGLLDTEELPPVIGERYRDVVSRMLHIDDAD